MIALAFLMIPAHVIAQSASVSDAGVIMLPNDQPLIDAYTIDISSFNFASTDEVLTFFKAANIQDVAMRPLLDNDVLMVYPQIKRQPDWTVQEWNQYLFTRQANNTPHSDHTK